MIDLIVPRKLEDRPERYKRIIYKKIQDYIKNGYYGDLFLSKTPIECLPSNLRFVGGDLHLDCSKILELPDNLKITTHLWLSNTMINSLPSGLKVGGDLFLCNTPLIKNYKIHEIKKMIFDHGGYVNGYVWVKF